MRGSLHSFVVLCLPLLLACGAKTVLDEPGLYSPEDAGADGAPDAKSDVKADAADAGGAWGCTQAVTQSGLACTCSYNPPAGQSIDPDKCKLSYGYACCQWDGKTCTCKQQDTCTPHGKAVVEECGEIFRCNYPIVHDGDTCMKAGLKCPGEGYDTFCSQWRCTCGSKGWDCLPGVCQ